MTDLEQLALRDGEPNFTLDKQIARARREMGELKWQQLCREWNEGTRDDD